MGDWIKVRNNLPGCPQVVRIMSATKRTKSDTIGALVLFWCAASEYSIDGALTSWTDDAVDAISETPGFAAALRAVGWLSDGSPGLQVPKWHEHNSASAKRRAKDRERKQKSRKTLSADCPQSVRKPSASMRTRSSSLSSSSSPDSLYGVESVREGGAVKVEDVYDAYPKHVKKSAALKAIASAAAKLRDRPNLANGKALAWLLERTRAYAESPLVKSGDKQFIPHPTTWFNGGQFDDDDSEWQRSNTNLGGNAGKAGGNPGKAGEVPAHRDAKRGREFAETAGELPIRRYTGSQQSPPPQASIPM